MAWLEESSLFYFTRGGESQGLFSHHQRPPNDFTKIRLQRGQATSHGGSWDSSPLTAAGKPVTLWACE